MGRPRPRELIRDDVGALGDVVEGLGDLVD